MYLKMAEKTEEKHEKSTELTEQQPHSAHLLKWPSETDSRSEDMAANRLLLVGRLKTGDNQAAEELVDLYYSRIYLFFRRLGHSRQSSEDLTQETFLQAWRHISRLRDEKTLNCWIYRIASNASKLYWRRNKGKKAVSIDDTELPPGDNNSFDNAEYGEQIENLKTAVLALPIKLRQTIVLHYMQHLTIAEAAEAAGVRTGTFKSRLNAALKNLKKALLI